MFEMNPDPKIDETELYITFSKKLENDVYFLDGLNNLVVCYGRIKIFHSKSGPIILNTELIDSAVRTLNSIKLCCSIGSFSDANTLIRKYRDDLLLYVYSLDVINNRKNFIEGDLLNLNTDNVDEFGNTFMDLRLNPKYTDDEIALEAWLNNKVNDLPGKLKFRISFENYMDRFKQNPDITGILSNYGLANYWEELRNKLNDYVHNNGLNYACHNNTRLLDKNLKTLLDNVNTRVSYITTFFLILIIMTDATLISSTDMIDHLDMGITPPEGAQYWIASFIQEYIDEKVIPLHPELKAYLKDKNAYGMDIN